MHQTMRFPADHGKQNATGKLDAASSIATYETAQQKTRRLFLTDSSTRIQFLIDTGADVSIITVNHFKNLTKTTNHFLIAANGTPIDSFGSKTVTVSFGLRREFTWKFIAADTNHSIIGADFLEFFNLAVDIRNKKLIDSNTGLHSRCNQINVVYQSIHTVTKSSSLDKIINDFKDLTLPPVFNHLKTENSGVTHRIITKEQPVFSRPRRLNPEMLSVAKTEFENMLKLGICQPSSSPWASPLHMAKKKNGQWRPCGDYRRLNAQTIHDQYPVPHIQDFTQTLSGTTLFTVLDLTRAYNQIPIHPDDREKTAIITPFGLFEFNVMTFGLRNAAQTFQRYMNNIFGDLDFVFVYIDDIMHRFNRSKRTRTTY